MCHKWPQAVAARYVYRANDSITSSCSEDISTRRRLTVSRSSDLACSLHLDVGRADYITPFHGFIGDELAKSVWRHRHWNAAQDRQPLLDL